jgi:DNA-binding transcriptional ArsR family regulator
VSDRLDSTFHALSHGTRREILFHLAGCPSEGERVSALAERYAISLNAVSKHIKVLEAAGLVDRRKAGREHFISLNPAPFAEVKTLVEFFSRFWMTRLDRLESHLRQIGDSPRSSNDVSS